MEKGSKSFYRILAVDEDTAWLRSLLGRKYRIVFLSELEVAR